MSKPSKERERETFISIFMHEEGCMEFARGGVTMVETHMSLF